MAIRHAKFLLNLTVVMLILAASLIAAFNGFASGIPSQQNAQSGDHPAANVERGARIVSTKCAACHGRDGNSTNPQYPKLAGQHTSYLYNQLLDFKSGIRSSLIMSVTAKGLSNSDAADAAAFFAQQPIQPDPVNDKKLAGIGERIFYNGTGAGRMQAACAACHSAAGNRMMMPMMGMMQNGMMGSTSAVTAPNLDGQHASYIINQLDRFASGERSGTVMGNIAASLSDADKKAVAEYLSGIQ